MERQSECKNSGKQFAVSELHDFFFLGVQSLRVDQETEDFVTIRVVFNERIKLLNLGVSVLSFYSERNTKNDLFVCMLLVASKAVGVSRTAYCMDFF